MMQGSIYRLDSIKEQNKLHRRLDPRSNPRILDLEFSSIQIVPREKKKEQLTEKPNNKEALQL